MFDGAAVALRRADTSTCAQVLTLVKHTHMQKPSDGRITARINTAKRKISHNNTSVSLDQCLGQAAITLLLATQACFERVVANQSPIKPLRVLSYIYICMSPCSLRAGSLPTSTADV